METTVPQVPRKPIVRAGQILRESIEDEIFGQWLIGGQPGPVLEKRYGLRRKTFEIALRSAVERMRNPSPGANVVAIRRVA